MSKIKEIVMELQEELESLGFSDIQEAIDEEVINAQF